MTNMKIPIKIKHIIIAQVETKLYPSKKDWDDDIDADDVFRTLVNLDDDDQRMSIIYVTIDFVVNNNFLYTRIVFGRSLK